MGILRVCLCLFVEDCSAEARTPHLFAAYYSRMHKNVFHPTFKPRSSKTIQDRSITMNNTEVDIYRNKIKHSVLCCYGKIISDTLTQTYSTSF